MTIEIEGVGEVKLVKNSRTSRVTARMKEGCMQVSYPQGLSLNSLKQILLEMQPRLKNLRERAPDKQLLLPTSKIQTLSFTLEIQENSLSNFYVSYKEGILLITYPAGHDLESEQTQAFFKETIEKTMRHEAKKIFPDKVNELASQYGFQFNEVKINKSKSRWGSCSSKKILNLSYFCLLLPENLIDFIILHELCHTREMNHGPKFWAYLDSVTNGRAKLLTKELKNFKTGW